MSKLARNNDNILDKISVIDTSSLVDKVERQIIVLIRTTGLEVGDSLPKELELANKFGVSRTVVREAFTRLKTMGLIESKKKQGAVLTNPDVLLPLRKIFHPSILDMSTLKDIFEMRLALELGMSDFIVQRVTDKDIEELSKIVSKEKQRDKQDVFDLQEEEAFHGKLYRISQNKLLLDMQSLLIPAFEYVNDSGMLKNSKENPKFVSHKGLVEVLKKRDAEAFRTAMRNHLLNHLERIL